MTMTRDNTIIDYITGKQVRATREEVESVQVFSRMLVEDYGYDKAQIKTHPQWRVKVRPSDTRKSYPVDIAVFSGDAHKDDSLLIVVECKKKERRDGIGQLKDYLRFSSARMGVWFNGDERVFLSKREAKGRVEFDEIPNIPRKGERLEDIGKHLRRDLKPPHNLKAVCRAIRNYLAGNAVGATRDEVLAQQFINMLFCKIYDERFTAPDNMLEFRAGVNEESAEVAERIHGLFNKVKSKYKDVFGAADEIVLDNRSLVHVVGELQNFCITESERDAIADAFEMFIGRALKGGLGQFFTPRNIVRLMVSIINPSSSDMIIDPACGSGGFLVETLKLIWGKLDEEGKRIRWSKSALNEEKNAAALNCIRGLEKDNFLCKVAKAYMAIVGDGKTGMFCEDSLEITQNWDAATRQKIDLGKFDFVFTNPPFGKDIKITGEEKLAQYELAQKWQYAKHSQQRKSEKLQPSGNMRSEARPEILFVERCIQLLRDGGVMGIVLPESFFHAPNGAHVLTFLERHNIQWVVDLPHNTFRPHNNAKCVFVVLQKNTKQAPKINMAVAEQMGHDHQGRVMHRWNTRTQKLDRTKVWDDIQSILDEIRGNGKKKHVFSIPAKQAQKSRVYVPRYYWETHEREVDRIAKREDFTLIPIRTLIEKGIIRTFDGDGSPRADYKGRGDVPYVRVKDIVNWEIYKDPTATIPNWVYQEMTKRKPQENFICPEDILYVRRGSYRIGSVAMVSPHDLNILTTKELLTFRIEQKNNEYGLDAYYLLFLLSHRLVKMQSFSKILIETTLPNIADRWLDLRLPFFADRDKAREVVDQVRKAVAGKWAAVEKIKRLRTKYGDITT